MSNAFCPPPPGIPLSFSCRYVLNESFNLRMIIGIIYRIEIVSNTVDFWVHRFHAELDADIRHPALLGAGPDIRYPDTNGSLFRYTISNTNRSLFRYPIYITNGSLFRYSISNTNGSLSRYPTSNTNGACFRYPTSDINPLETAEGKNDDRKSDYSVTGGC